MVSAGEIIRRSQLVVPASSVELIGKASRSAADSVIIDLEDAIAPSEKDAARQVAVDALEQIDFGAKEICVRVNGVGTPWFMSDMLAIPSVKIHNFVFPKVNSEREVHFLSDFLAAKAAGDGIECAKFQVLIESALAVENAYEIARSSDALTAIIFGVGDYLADTGLTLGSLGVELARGKVAQAALAAKVPAVDHVMPYIKDISRLQTEAQQGRAYGFSAKWAIHPLQVETINKVFSPSESEISEAVKIVEGYEKALDRGIGAITIDGQLVDEAVLKIMKARLRTARGVGLLPD